MEDLVAGQDIKGEEGKMLLTTKVGTKITIRKITTEFHAFGRLARVVAFVDGTRRTASGLGQNNEAAIANAKRSLVAQANLMSVI